MVIILFKNIIEHYINIIDINDVIMFAKKENIEISEKEAKIVLNYLKNNWQNVIYGSDEITKNFLRENFAKEKCHKIYCLLLAYKKKYRNYL